MPPRPTASFAELIALEPDGGPDGFVGPPAPERGGRTYGGQFLAQALAAAYRTVPPERRVHSLYASFLRAGDVDEITRWSVETVRDGRSFGTRSVIGRQRDAEVFRLSTSFQTPEDGLDYQPEPDLDLSTIPDPDLVTTTYVDFANANPDLEPGVWFGQDRPMEIRYIDPPAPETATTDPQLTWTRISEPLGDDPVVHDLALAYLADATLVDHVLLPHGHRWHDSGVTGASLDHAMWFHRSAPADRWLLYDQRVESTSGSRGLARGRFYTSTGTLIATCNQEGLMRWRPAGSVS